MNNDIFNLLPAEDLNEKLSRIRENMLAEGLDSILIGSNVNKYYLTGRVFSGFIFISPQIAKWFVRRPAHFTGPDVVTIRKVENIAEHIDGGTTGNIGFELNTLPYNTILRYAKAFGAANFGNADTILSKVRSVKTDYEVGLIKKSSDRLGEVYRRVPNLFRNGMTDVELQIEIEKESRLNGCLGIFRIDGQEMEFHMGNVLVGDNADSPSPYDFAMGGAGADPSLPVGADGSKIKKGNTVMVDTNGNFTGYMTDMTRTFTFGEVSEKAVRAQQLSIDICRRIAAEGRPGVPASRLYEIAFQMARDAGLERNFMGHNSQAGFVGHGVGIVINELPVLAPRSKDILCKNNVIAVEPKFVIEGVGAVGIENTYVVTESGMKCLTDGAPEHFVPLPERD